MHRDPARRDRPRRRRTVADRPARHLARTTALPTVEALRAPVVEGIARPARPRPRRRRPSIVLTPSGTDTESLVAALVLGPQPAAAAQHPRRRSRSRLRHVACRPPAVSSRPARPFVRACAFPATRSRDSTATALRSSTSSCATPAVASGVAFDVEAEVEAHVEHAIECNEQVLVHAMACVEDGLRQTRPGVGTARGGSVPPNSSEWSSTPHRAAVRRAADPRVSRRGRERRRSRAPRRSVRSAVLRRADPR